MHNFVQAKQEINAIFGHLTKYLEVRSEFSADYRIADEDERDIDKFSCEVRVLIIAQRDTIIIRIGIKKFVKPVYITQPFDCFNVFLYLFYYFKATLIDTLINLFIYLFAQAS